jgi:8-oxo-dGTP diphosphatase
MSDRSIRVVAAVIQRDGRYLITQRRDEAVLPRLWEFPGGKLEPGEDDEGALEREVEGRLGVRVQIGARMAERHHDYSGYQVTLALYACTLPEGAEPRPLRVRDLRWVTSGEFGAYPFPPADQATMDQLLDLEGQR